MNCIGLDIGTTSVCVCAVDSQSGKMLESVTFNNDYSVSGKPFERCQNPDAIVEKCIEVIDAFIKRHSPVCCIGITGQMHGIVYLDSCGEPVSSLYTWQDLSGEEMFSESESFAEHLSRITGHKMASGFGCTTYYYQKNKASVPEQAAKICTIHDFAAMKLCGLTEPVMHSSDAASFGLFDIKNFCFDKDAIEKAGLDYNLFPEVVTGAAVIGRHCGIPVCVAIGDNQASFIGSVKDTEQSVLINIGTGSQVSFMTKDDSAVKSTELRPCDNDRFIRVGSALCGGRAFAVLEKFIRSTMNLGEQNVENAYPFIDKLLESTAEPENPLSVDTAFCGTRDNPDYRGSVSNLSLDNFTPENLIYGVLHGITDELYNMYKPCKTQEHKYVVGSGNGLRKNKALQKIIAETFGMELLIPEHKEEAAYGAVLYALTACQKFNSLHEAQSLIRYK